MVRLLSINVNGLRNAKKRQNIFNWLNNQNSDIILIQETHCESEQVEKVWKTDWKGSSFWNHGTNLSKGIAFLIQEHTTVKIIAHDVCETSKFFKIRNQ